MSQNHSTHLTQIVWLRTTWAFAGNRTGCNLGLRTSTSSKAYQCVPLNFNPPARSQSAWVERFLCLQEQPYIVGTGAAAEATAIAWGTQNSANGQVILPSPQHLPASGRTLTLHSVPPSHTSHGLNKTKKPTHTHTEPACS